MNVTMQTQANTVSVPHQLLTCREAAKLLGISERKLWGLTKKGILPMVKMHKTVRYRPEDVRKYVESCLSATA